MRLLQYIITVVVLVLALTDVSAQPLDRRDVRKGNRDFRKENYREAEIDYRKALVKDSTSVAANYNLASTLYREGDMQQAKASLDKVRESAPMTASAADYWYNVGDVALALQDYKTAVDAFAQSLMINPADLDAKENYIYAKKKLQDQQNQQDQNQDQNRDQNQDQNKDQNQNQDQNKDQEDNQNQDQNQDQNQNQKQDQNQSDQDRNQGQQPKISPQAAQQMLQAIQAKEKETQDKVNEKKAQALKSRQKDKNW